MSTVTATIETVVDIADRANRCRADVVGSCPSTRRSVGGLRPPCDCGPQLANVGARCGGARGRNAGNRSVRVGGVIRRSLDADRENRKNRRRLEGYRRSRTFGHSEPTLSIAGFALSVAQAVSSSDLATETRFQDPMLRQRGLIAAAAMPLLRGNKYFGALLLAHTQPRLFDAR